MSVPGPSLCQRNPATTQSAVRWCLILSIARLPGWYGASSRLAITPSSPAPSNRSNQSAAWARSRVAGVRWIGGAGSPRTASSRARRSACGTARQVLVAEGEQVPGDEARRRLARPASGPATRPGGSAAAARRSRAPRPARRSRPRRRGRTARAAPPGAGRPAPGSSGRAASGRATGCRPRRRRGRRSPGSRPTWARTASRRPSGSPSDGLASIGSSGGVIGRRTLRR